MASFDGQYDAEVCEGGFLAMRTTVNIDDDMLEEAKRLTGISENAAVIRLAVQKLVEREAARRLARLGGTMPDLTVLGCRPSLTQDEFEAS
jgi:Arc/MetJ family transcription regulator